MGWLSCDFLNLLKDAQRAWSVTVRHYDLVVYGSLEHPYMFLEIWNFLSDFLAFFSSQTDALGTHQPE